MARANMRGMEHRRWLVAWTMVLLAAVALPLSGAQGQNTPPTARLYSLFNEGNVEEGDGLGSLFDFRAGNSHDAEDTWAELLVRWSVVDEVAPRTPWAPMMDNGRFETRFHHPGAYVVRLEVQDSGGLVSTAQQEVLVRATKQLAWNTPTSSYALYEGDQRFFVVEIPDGPTTATATLDYGWIAGVDLDLYGSTDGRPDPQACSRPQCHESTSRSTGGTERICWRLPEAGTYQFSIHANSHPGMGPVPFDFVVREEPMTVTSHHLRCLAFGSDP